MYGTSNLFPEVLRALRAVQVVPDEQDEVVLELLVNGEHLLRHLVLRPPAGPEVAQDGELERAVPVGQGHRLFGLGWLLGLDNARSGADIDRLAVPRADQEQREQESKEPQMAWAHMTSVI